MILIAIGLVKLVDANTPSGHVAGAILVGVGAVLLGQTLGYLRATLPANPAAARLYAEGASALARYSDALWVPKLMPGNCCCRLLQCRAGLPTTSCSLARQVLARPPSR